jgi:hypothetical protein
MKKLMIAALAAALTLCPMVAYADATPTPTPTPTPTFTPFTCPEYKVPGWLDENGNPTSCVDNSPCPGLVPPACLPVAEPAKPIVTDKELAYTGPVDGWLAFPGGAVLIAGGLLLWIDRGLVSVTLKSQGKK